jgi:membrane-associated phospholipid phosphatase
MDRLRSLLRFGRPLLADAARPWAGAVLAGSAILVAVLGVLFASQTTADRFDHAVDSPVIGWFAGHGDLAFRLASPGTLIPAAALSGVIAVICVLTGRLNGALLAGAAVPVADGLDEGLLKHLVHRTYLGQLAYPSGHTTAVFAIAATITIVFLVPPQVPGTRVLRLLATAAAYVVAGIVVISVIAVRWHYFTDTVGGAAVGIGAVCGLALILDLPAIRQRLTPPQETESRVPVTRPSRAAKT